MATYVYSSSRVKCSWLGIDLTPGLAAGTYFSLTDNKPAFTWIPDGQGGGIRLYDEDRSGEITLTTDSEHPLHQRLIALAEYDKIGKNLFGPFYFTDLSNGQKILMPNAYIKNEADEQRATSSVPATWLFHYTSKTTVPQLQTQNLLGS